MESHGKFFVHIFLALRMFDLFLDTESNTSEVSRYGDVVCLNDLIFQGLTLGQNGEILLVFHSTGQ